MKKIFLTSVLLFQFAQAQELVRHEELGYKYLFPDKFAIDIKAYIKYNGGLKAPVEILELNFDPKNQNKDLIFFQAEKYSLYYPKCYEITSSTAGFNDPKKSIGNSIVHRKSCLNDNSNSSKNILYYENEIGVGYDTRDQKTISQDIYDSLYKANFFAEDEIYRQKMKINSIPMLALGTISQNSSKLHLRMIFITFCQDKLFYFSYSAPEGEATNEIVKKGTYEIPEDFKQIISSFKCNEKPAKKKK